MNSGTLTLSSPLLILGLLACEQRLPEFRYETEHLRIATDFDEPLCRGDLDHYESVITQLETVLGTSVDGRTDVHLWDLTMDGPGWCSADYAAGCYQDGVVYADQSSIAHELAHVVIASIGSPADFWNEGTAESLQSDQTFFSTSKPSDNIDLESPYLSYRTAGHFSNWLFKTYGLEPYRALLRAPGSARDAFEQTYGMTIEQAEELYFAQAPYSYGAFMACDHPDLPLVGEMQWSETIEIDCGKPHVHGGPNGMAAWRVLTVTERDDYTFSTTAETGVIGACPDRDLATPPEYGDPALGDIPPRSDKFVSARTLAGDGVITTLDLIPGRYEVLVGYRSDYGPHTARLDVQVAQP
jgi:hypothetical protein